MVTQNEVCQYNRNIYIVTLVLSVLLLILRGIKYADTDPTAERKWETAVKMAFHLGSVCISKARLTVILIFSM